MLPIGKVQVGRDWMELFTVLVWATVILIMFLSKLKAAQDVLIAVILGSIMAIMNADLLFARLRIYKIYLVLRKLLLKECLTSAVLSFVCLMLHGMWPEAVAPGILLHISSLAAWVSQGVQTSPVVSSGLWLGGQNVMTKNQLVLHVLAHCTGTCWRLRYGASTIPSDFLEKALSSIFSAWKVPVEQWWYFSALWHTSDRRM